MVVSASNSLTTRLTAGGLQKAVTIPMGVTPGIFSPTFRDESLRAQMLAQCGLGPDATLLLGLGRLGAEKRWPMVIDAVKAAGFDNPVGLLILGNGRDRARVIREASNNPHVHLGAPVTDRPALATIIASADALIHGCEAETFCMVAAEAKASGLPLIVPDEGGAVDQFVAGQGQIYRARSGASLADAIGRFVAEGPATQRAAAARGASSVQSMDAHFDNLFAAYAEKLSAHRDIARAA
jgi:alpha-1,6-mannosyltransferase